MIRATTADNIITYQYDGFGRRIAKKIYDTQYSLLTTQSYVYDGDQVIAEYDGSGTLQQKYVYGPGIDEPIQVTSHTSQVTGTFYYHSDGLGSITALTDAAGNVVEKYEYDAYGDIIIKDANDAVLSQSAVGNRFGFTGREYDSETGLYYYRARMYSPILGRFLQTDPIGYYDSMNLYQYCGNNPGNYTDPSGLLGINGFNIPFGVGMPLPMPVDWSKYITDLFKKQQEGAKVDEEEGECKGQYFRHWTSYEGLEGILSEMAIRMSLNPNNEFGPGVYFTEPGVPPWFIRNPQENRETFIDVWVPKRISSDEKVWHYWGEAQWTYTGGSYPICADPKHPPITGPTRREDD